MKNKLLMICVIRNLIQVVSVFMGLFLLVGNVNAEDVKLRLHGSNTVGAKLAPELVQTWLKSKKYKIDQNIYTADEERLITAHDQHGQMITVEIYSHGSSTAFTDLNKGTTDIGMSSRPIKSTEITALSSRGQLDQAESEYVLALDGLAIIVHPSNPLTYISKDNLQKIFSGNIHDWAALGLPSGPIHLYARDDKSGTYDTFKSLVLNESSPLSKEARRFESSVKLSDEVSQDRYGIGFIGLAYIQKSKVVAVSDHKTKPLLPHTFNIGTEDYPLARRLFLYVPTRNTHPLAKEFAEYTVSAQAQSIIASAGYIPQQVVAEKVTLDSTAPDEYKEMTKNAQRLSLNIRFLPGVVQLDNKAVRDVQRLIEYRLRPENRQKRFMLFGFSDANESLPYMSYSLSVNRADAVGDYLIRNGLAPIRVRGYGHEIPVASNDSERGRYHNRRVEVWVQ